MDPMFYPLFLKSVEDSIYPFVIEEFYGMTKRKLIEKVFLTLYDKLIS